jgi:hypothetical protein
VTPYNAAQLEAGGTALQIQQAVIRTTAGAGAEEAGPLKPIVDLLLVIIDALVSISRGGPVPEPRPTVG